MNKKNLVGVRFGFWLVIDESENGKNKQTQWLCECECGIKRVVTANSLRTGNSTSCGCNNTPSLINNTYGKLLVVKLEENKDKNRRYWCCKCDCGNTLTVSTLNLRNNKITSCKNCKLDKSKKNEIIKGYDFNSYLSIINLIKLNLEILKNKNHLICLEKIKKDLEKIAKI